MANAPPPAGAGQDPGYARVRDFLLYSPETIGSLGRGALSTAKAAGTLLDRHVIDHYRAAITEIRQRGLYACLAQTARPYAAAVWENFSPDKATLTEDAFSGRLIARAWRAMGRRLGF